MEFSERQRFRQPWIKLTLPVMWIMTVVVFTVGLYRQLKLGIPFGSSPMSDQGLIVTSLLTFLLVTGLNLLLATATLITHIDSRFISYRFKPFHRDFRRIAWKEVREAQVITYHPIRQFGGWGIRYGKGGTAYNVSGNMGMQLILKNGKMLLIGTSKAVELSEFLKTLGSAMH